LKEKQQKARS